MLIYKTHMHPEASLSPEQCTPTLDTWAKNSWLHAHIKSIDQYDDVYNPEPHEGDTYMEEDTTPTEEATLANQGLPPSGTGQYQDTTMEKNDRRP